MDAKPHYSLPVLVLTEAQLQALLERAAARALEQLPPPEPNVPERYAKLWWDIPTVAGYWGVTRQTVSDWVNQGILVRHHIGGRPVFHRDQVLNAPVPERRATGRRQTRVRRQI